jgi:hypothetical protein
MEKYGENDLIDCISNKNVVYEVVKNPKQMFKGPGGHNLAAMLIQKIWKGYRAFSNFK